jgi:uncharacterized membrane protein YkgB
LVPKPSWFDRVDTRVTRWMARHGVRLLRISLGIVFLWFGVLKFFPGVSPAETLAKETIAIITGDHVPSNVAIMILATWECAIGIGLMFRIFLRTTILLLFLQMIGAVLPLFLLADEAFTRIPWAPTLEGQYIIKNIVLISAAVVVGATVRGAGLSEAPPGAGHPELETKV